MAHEEIYKGKNIIIEEEKLQIDDNNIPIQYDQDTNTYCITYYPSCPTILESAKAYIDAQENED